MTMNRRSVTAGLASALALPSLVRAQEAWPKGRQIKFVIPFPPAGATDVLGRLMADKLGPMWGATTLVENKPGAGGNIGTDIVAKAAPDGNTVLVFSVGMATNQYLYSKLTYDPVKDFEPVGLIAMVPNVLTVSNDKPYKTVKELIDYAKANPGKVNYASSGIGTSIHLAGELFQQMTGTKMNHVPYKGSGPALVDLMSGQVDIMFDNITAVLPKIRAGQLRGMAITTAKKSPFAPEFEPVANTVPGFDVSSWFAVFVPAKTPKEIINRFAADMKVAIADPVVKERMAGLAAEAVDSGPEHLRAMLASESAKWGKVIKDNNIKAE
jgi:tripartite-type tricarboxylate transporter receptor subunit TctC